MLKTKLNLGCGKDIREDWINIDIQDFGGNVVHDLETFPYPIKSNSIEEIEMKNSFEHITKQVELLEECYRVCKDHAIIQIYSPHFASISTYQDPTHKRGISWNYFTFFNRKDSPYNYTNNNCDFVTASKLIEMPKPLKWFEWFANKYPGFYETNLCFIIRPAYMKVILIVRK